MSYQRPKPTAKIPPEQKESVIREYIQHYRELYACDQDALNRKIPRKAFEPVLIEIGELLKKWAREIADGEGGDLGEEVNAFLNDNPLPRSMAEILTPELRAYALLVHALRQWGTAEALATDRWLLSGKVRQILRTATDRCLVTGEPMGEDEVELHHPVRDGRPPVPVSKKGHALIEKQQSPASDDPIGSILGPLRKIKGGSWVALWQGCCLQMGESVDVSSAKRAAYCRSLANRYAKDSGFSFQEMRVWIEEQGHVELLQRQD